jgi:primary-amine oxidase
MAFLVDTQDQAPDGQAPRPHPLAPLTAAEIKAAASAVKAADCKRIHGVQPSVMLEEFLAAEDLVRKDPRWQEAMRKRGIQDFSLCMIDPWSTPNVQPDVGPDDGRFVSPLTWLRDDPADNGYAHPVEGVITRVNLDTLTVDSVEDHGVVTLPIMKANYSTEKIKDPDNIPFFPDGPRKDVKPLDLTQHEGPSFQLDGYHLTWQKWDLRIGFTAREGLVLHRISYQNRSIIHRASLSEMFVPYGDPGPPITASWSLTKAVARQPGARQHRAGRRPLWSPLSTGITIK